MSITLINIYRFVATLSWLEIVWMKERVAELESGIDKSRALTIFGFGRHRTEKFKVQVLRPTVKYEEIANVKENCNCFNDAHYSHSACDSLEESLSSGTSRIFHTA